MAQTETGGAAPAGGGGAKRGPKPKRGETVRYTLDLTPPAAKMLDGFAATAGQPPWKVVDDLIRKWLGKQRLPRGAPPPEPGTLAHTIGAEAAAYLALRTDSPAAAAALRQAWQRALAMAVMASPAVAPLPPPPPVAEGASQGGGTPDGEGEGARRRALLAMQ
jgi:hypothetical protein